MALQPAQSNGFKQAECLHSFARREQHAPPSRANSQPIDHRRRRPAGLEFSPELNSNPNSNPNSSSNSLLLASTCLYINPRVSDVSSRPAVAGRSGRLCGCAERKQMCRACTPTRQDTTGSSLARKSPWPAASNRLPACSAVVIGGRRTLFRRRVICLLDLISAAESRSFRSSPDARLNQQQPQRRESF